jgi:hypothetical protein
VLNSTISSDLDIIAADMQEQSASNRPWDISPAAGGTLRIGSQHLLLAKVHGIAASAREERDFLGCLLNYSAYLIVAAIFLVLVVQVHWRERFLLGTLFFALVGFTSLIDIWRTKGIRLYQLAITLTDGNSIIFTSVDPTEVDRLAAALRPACGSSCN